MKHDIITINRYSNDNCLKAVPLNEGIIYKTDALVVHPLLLNIGKLQYKGPNRKRRFLAMLNNIIRCIAMMNIKMD